MAWTPPTDAVVVKGWTPPEDAEDEEPSYGSRVLDNLGGMAMAGVDMVGGIPGFVAGQIAGKVPQFANNDPVGGEELANEVIGKTLPSAALGMDMSKNPGYELGMKPLEIAMEAYNKLASVPGKIGKNLYGLDDSTVERIDAATRLGGMGVMAAGGAKGIKPKEASPYAGTKKLLGLEHLTDAEYVDWAKARDAAERNPSVQNDTPIEHPTPQMEPSQRPPIQQDLSLGDRNDPLLASREGAQGEVRSALESQEFLNRELTGTKDMFGQDTGLERPDVGLEQKRPPIDTPVVEGPDISKGYESGFDKTKNQVQDTGTPDNTQYPLRIEEPEQRPASIPYTNTIHDYIYSRFPELTETLQKDPVVKRLMKQVQDTTDHMLELRDNAGKEFAGGVSVKLEDLRTSKKAQAEMDRLKGQYERSAQMLDAQVQQLGNRLKSRSKGLGIDIANNAKFADWINGKLGSSGPLEGQMPRSLASGKGYKEGDASRNIKKSDPLPGQTKIGGSQRGAVGFKSDTPFQKFEKGLPIPYQKLAPKLWAEIQSKKTDVSFIDNKDQIAKKDILNGLVGGKELYIKDTTPFKAAKPRLMQGPDLTGSQFKHALANLLTPGANLRAFITRDPRIKYASDNIRAAKDNARTAVHNKLFGDDGMVHLFEKLTGKEQIAVWKLVEKNKGVKDLTVEELKSSGMNQKQIDFYNSSRKHFKDSFNELVAEKIAAGDKPPVWQPGYWTSSWKGDYFFEVRKRHEDGRVQLVRLETGNWKGIGGKGGLAGVRDRFLAEQGHIYEVGPIEQRARKGSSKEMVAAYDQLRDMVNKDHPDAEALDRLFEKYNEEVADSTRNFREHFKISHGVEGYQGSELGVSDIKNAQAMIRSAEGYFTDMHEYLETKKAARNVNGLLFDKDIRESHKNSLKYVRMYWDNARGIEPTLARFINYLPEKMAESVGLSRYAPKKAAQVLRSQMMLFFLGYNRPTFVFAQRVQSAQFSIPAMIRMKTDLGLEGWNAAVAEASLKGYTESMLSMTEAGVGISKLGKEALEYAVTNRTVNQYFLDDIRTVGQMKVSQSVKFLQGETALRWADTSSRLDAYLQFVHLMEKSGMKGEELFGAATDAMKRAMVDYSPEERPMIYNELGLVGDMLSPLTTFPHNYYSQLYAYGKEALKHPTEGYAKAAVAILLAQYIAGGYMGMPGRQEGDWIIDFARAHGMLDPRTKNVTQALASWSDGIQSDGSRNTIRYGAYAGITGMDVSPTFGASMLLPDHGVGGKMPVPAKALEIAGNAVNVGSKELGRLGGGQGSTMVDRAKLQQSATPPAFKWTREATTQDPKTGMIPNPNDHMSGDVRRGPFSLKDKNWQAAVLGTTSIKESEERAGSYQKKMQDEAIKQRKISLISSIIDLQMSNMDFSKQRKAYMELGGTPNTMVKDIVDAQKAKNQTRWERAKGVPKDLGSALGYKRANEYGVSK